MTAQLSADIVVIGSGICGSLAARQLAAKGASVLMLESGPRIDRGLIVSNFRNSPRKADFMSPYPSSPWSPHPLYGVVDNNYLEQAGPYPYKAQYIRGVGGTSWHWAAQAWRFVPNDFRIQSMYGVGRDWPISYDELEPFYYQAEVLMGVSGPDNNGSPRSKPFPMDPVAESWAQKRFREQIAPLGYDLIVNTTARNSRNYDGRPACCGNNNCMPICPIDAQYHGGIAARSAEASGVKIVENAVVYRIESDASGKIAAVHYYDPNKQSVRVIAKQFLLAANGIESPKLLLLSADDKHPDGIANSSGTVGRNLMDHPSNKFVFETEEPLWPGRGPMSPGSIGKFRDGDFRKEMAAARIDLNMPSQVAPVAQDLIKQGVYGKALQEQFQHRAARQFSIKSVTEILPDPENRIVLSDNKDALGIPKPRVHYHMSSYVDRSMDMLKPIYAEIIKAMGGTNIRTNPDGVYDNNQHITGTMSMGNDPKTSVVDAWGRSHDHENLFIASTGVMPTAGTCNSTLTAVALALRTASKMGVNG
ncbi:GMC family oxidoreductase [Frateuria aurantia]